MNFRSCCTDLDKAYIPIPVETSVNGKDYVLFGEMNDMPQTYYDCYTDCSILQSVINAVTDYISGSGINTNEMTINRNGDNLTTIIKKATLDYVIFGAMALQVIRNKMGEIAEINWIDVRNVRLDEDGKKVYYAKNWGKYTRNVKAFDRWNTAEMYPSSIFYYKNPKSRSVYGNPIWGGALRDVLTLVEASKQNYTNMLNQFSPNVLISFNNGAPTEEIQDEVEDLINKKFSGADGNKIMVSWSDSKEYAPEVTSFQTEDYTNKYIAVMNAAQNNILAAFRMSAQLAGISTQATGFSDIEYENSFKVFKETVIKPMQSEIEAAFKALGFDFVLKEFQISFNNE